MDAPAYPGCIVEIRLLGVLEADQTEDGATVRNDRLIAVAMGATERGDLDELADMAPALMTQIESFFSTYCELDGKTFKARDRRGPRRAETLARKAQLPS